MNNTLVKIALKVVRTIESNNLLINQCTINNTDKTAYIERSIAYHEMLRIIESNMGENSEYEEAKKSILTPRKKLVYSADKWNKKMI
jgi:hypothetical protein